MPGPFENVMPTPEEHALMAGLRRRFAELHEDMIAACPRNSYLEQATRDLVASSHWAMKAITHEPK